jgi:hypothetical protein
LSPKSILPPCSNKSVTLSCRFLIASISAGPRESESPPPRPSPIAQ